VTDFFRFDGNFIDGSFVPGSGKLGIEDPATEEIFTEVHTAGAAQFDTAIAGAYRSFESGVWARTPMPERVATVLRMTEWLAAHRDMLVETLIRETGSTALIAEWAQFGMALDQARQLPELFATLPEWEHNELPLEAHFGPDLSDVLMSVRQYEPVGVVAAITPYNFPLQTNVWKVICALVAGCSVVLRPSPLTPLSGLVFGLAAAEAGLPGGVLNVVVEEGSEGAQLLSSDPRVDCVSFTGSTAVGRLIAAQAAPTVKRLCLELGGKSVQLYLPDALEKVVAGVCTVFGAHAGQGCVVQGRVLVPLESLDQVVEATAAAAELLQVGDPRDPKTLVGPLITAVQRDRVGALVDEGVAAGAKLATGGGRPPGLDRGYFFEPTVLVVEDNSNPVAQREVFGPVVTIQGYRDLDHAIAIANDTEYGLSGGIYTHDLKAGLDIARRIRSGTVQVNRSAANAWTPAGGVKQSGIGRERGAAGLREFQEIKHIVLAPLT
jgi:aldehyde dehydrogenase (NAD+)